MENEHSKRYVSEYSIYLITQWKSGRQNLLWRHASNTCAADTLEKVSFQDKHGTDYV